MLISIAFSALTLYTTLYIFIHRFLIKKNPHTRLLTKKVVIITNCASELGKTQIIELLKRGATVIFTSQNSAAAKSTISDIQAEKSFSKKTSKKLRAGSWDLFNNFQSGCLYYRVVNYSNFDQIEKFSKWVKFHFDSIDTICNISNCSDSEELKSEKKEETLAISVNHLSHFFLTHELLPHISSSEARVINLCSLGNEAAFVSDDDSYLKLNEIFEKVEKKNKKVEEIRILNRTKLSNKLFAKKLNNHFEKLKMNAKAVSAHPGKIYTKYTKKLDNGILRRFLEFLTPIGLAMTEEEAAQTGLVTFLVSFEKLKGGEFYSGCEASELDEKIVKEPEYIENFWTKSLELIELAINRKLKNFDRF